MANREARLVEAARAALRYFNNRLGGSGVNGPNDTLFIGRQLAECLEDWSDVPDPRIANTIIIDRVSSQEGR